MDTKKTFNWENELNETTKRVAFLSLAARATMKMCLRTHSVGHTSQNDCRLFERELAAAHLTRCVQELKLLEKFHDVDGDWRDVEFPLTSLPEREEGEPSKDFLPRAKEHLQKALDASKAANRNAGDPLLAKKALALEEDVDRALALVMHVETQAELEEHDPPLSEVF